jgi:pilus assembly protein Flp/PilA
MEIHRMRGGNGMLIWMRGRLGGEEGQALVEYALLVSLIAVVCIAALTITGRSISDIINTVAGSV